MLSRLEISQSDFDELTAFIKEKYGLDLARKKSIVESRLSNYVLDCGFNSFSEYLSAVYSDETGRETANLINRLTNHKKKKEILALFEATGIPDKTDERAGKLSFGQQQRVAFIRSLCQPFDFIFLDEPISHLDNDNSAIMSRLLMEEAGKQGAGIIVTSIGKHLELEYDETFRL